MFGTTTSLKDLCTPRDFDPAIFTPSPGLTLKSPLKDHVAWAYQLYRKPYPSSEEKTRILHGIQHVTRAALYVIPLVNLYRRYGDKAAIDLTEEEIKLLQIALLFHDSARLNEGADRWDTQSAELLYYYFINVLKVNEETASKICHAVADKDPTDGKFNIYQAIIHDADCLDILRARSQFDADYLQFYQQYAKHNENAFKDMNILICEARSIIDTQGDSFQQINLKVKEKFEHAKAHDAILQTFQQTHTPTPRLESAVHSNQYRLFPALSTIRPLDELKGMSFEDKWVEDKETKNIYKNADTLRTAIFRDGIVLARACENPSVERHKKIKDDKTDKLKTQIDSLAGYDFYKMGRGNTWSARTKKKNSSRKKANYNRSSSVLGPGTLTYGSAGYLFSKNLDCIHAISDSSIDSGTGKKRKYITPSSSTTTIKETLWSSLLKKQRAGKYKNNRETRYNEIICDIVIDDVKAIYFSHDLQLSRTHYTSILEAIFLQRQYEIMTKRKIPIFEYSGLHSDITYRGEYSDDEIVEIWVRMTTSYITETNNLEDLRDIEQIKFSSMYRKPYPSTSRDHRISYHAIPADSNYSKELKQKINNAIQQKRDEILKQKNEFVMKKLLDSKEINFFEDAIYQTLVMNPSLLDQHEPIKKKLEDFIQKNSIPQLELFLTRYLALINLVQGSVKNDIIENKIKPYVKELIITAFEGAPRIGNIIQICHQLDLKEIEEVFLTKIVPNVLEKYLKLIDPRIPYDALKNTYLIATSLVTHKKITHDIFDLIFLIINQTLELINHQVKDHYHIANILTTYAGLAASLNVQFPNIIPFKKLRELIGLHIWMFDSSSCGIDLTSPAFLEKDKEFFIKAVKFYGYDKMQKLKDRFVTFDNWQVEAILEKHPLSDQKNIVLFMQFISDYAHLCNDSMLKIIIDRLHEETREYYPEYRKQVEKLFPDASLLSHSTPLTKEDDHPDTSQSVKRSFS